MKTIVDSSVWISHLRNPVEELVSLLETGDVLMHPAIIGELACGGFRHRTSILADLKRLPRADEARFDEICGMIEDRRLYGKGLGWVDCQLLASTALMGAQILTYDQTLATAASKII